MIPIGKVVPELKFVLCKQKIVPLQFAFCFTALKIYTGIKIPCGHIERQNGSNSGSVSLFSRVYLYLHCDAVVYLEVSV